MLKNIVVATLFGGISGMASAEVWIVDISASYVNSMANIEESFDDKISFIIDKKYYPL